jgi:hypothetical protein
VGAFGANKSQVASVAARRVAIERQALAELRKLRAPAKLALDWQRVVSDTGFMLAWVVRVGDDASLHGATNVGRFRNASYSAARIRLLVAATHAGLKQCAFVL